jgi:hypothetical protein
MFTHAELEEILPQDILGFFNNLLYGNPAPPAGAHNPICSSMIEQYKKCISYFMPNQEHQWRHGLGGNPTWS